MFNPLFYGQELCGLGGPSLLCSIALSLPIKFNPEASVECKWWGPVLDSEVTMGNGFACSLHKSQLSPQGSLPSYRIVICFKKLRNCLNFSVISWSKDTVSLSQSFPEVCV